jgi:hypothetical protein
MTDVVIFVKQHSANVYSAETLQGHYADADTRARAISRCVGRLNADDKMQGRRWAVEGENLAGTVARRKKAPPVDRYKGEVFDALGGKMNGAHKMKRD